LSRASRFAYTGAVKDQSVSEKNTWHRDCHCQRYINANQERIYQLVEERECRDGHAVEDWIDAAIRLAPESATQVQFNRAE